MDVSNLTGKTALVTGAGSGIGRETALAFARRGADMLLCDVNKQGLDDTAARIASLDRGDVATHVVKKARKRFYASVTRALTENGTLVIFGHHGKARQYLQEFASFGFHPVDPGALVDLTDKELNRAYRAGIRFTVRRIKIY